MGKIILGILLILLVGIINPQLTGNSEALINIIKLGIFIGSVILIVRGNKERKALKTKS